MREMTFLASALKDFGLALACCMAILLADLLIGLTSLRYGLEWGLNNGAVAANWMGKALVSPKQMLEYWYAGSRERANMLVKVNELTVETTELTKLKAENELLRNYLKYNPEATQTQIFRLAMSGREYLVLGGERKGVRQGMIALDPNQIVVGRIEVPGKFIARIITPEKLGEKIAVKLLRVGVEGVLSGDGTAAILTGIPNGMDINLGDVVVTAGTDDLYPPDLTIGEVAAILSKPADVSLTFKVNLLSNRTELVGLYQ